MKNINAFIQSGIVELYVLRLASDKEMLEVEKMSALHPAVQQAIDLFCDNLKKNGFANATVPPPSVKTMVMASIDLMKRMQTGEKLGNPVALNNDSKIIDYAEWLNRLDMVPPANYNNMYAKIIGYTPTITTAIVWIKSMALQEVHTNEFERFLIVEGTCDITISSEVNHLMAGDYLAIPLYEKHHVVVTSIIPCKVVLQRIAA